MDELPFCKCGCGRRVKNKGSKYCQGHNMRGRDVLLKTRLRISSSLLNPKPKPEALLCKCGCGELAKPGNTFVFGHAQRGENYYKPKSIAKLCECECGEYALPGNDYINGHYWIGKKHSPETIKLLGENNRMKDPDVARKCGLSHRGTKHPTTTGENNPSKRDDVRKKISKKVRNSEIDKWLLNHQNKHLCECGCGKVIKILRVHYWNGIPKYISGHNNWQGGISFEPYCPKFNEECRKHNRDKYNNCDYFSGLPDYICNVANGKVRKLSVHHIDLNKNQGCDEVEWKLIPLSGANHGRVHINKDFWERLICYALEYDETYYNIKQIDIMERIEWK